MKKLKYLHPFNGKKYPLYVSCIAATILPLIVISFDLNIPPVIVMIAAFLLSMTVCLLIEQHLSEEERDLIAQSQSPLWHPVNDKVRRMLTAKYADTQESISSMALGSVVIGALAGLFFLLPPRHSLRPMHPELALPAAVFGGLIGFVVTMLRKGRGAGWLSIDDSAMFTVIPVHHCFDVKHYVRHRYVQTFPLYETRYVNYLVFYQPDGRYVLRIPRNAGECRAVVVVTCQGNVTWMPASTLIPEEFL